MEESSSLKLIIEKGPRAGETLGYTSRSVVKIGRVVRGNTIAIKDAGISSKHIRIEFDNQLNEWTLSDLDSSNGTILNGQVLKPNVPVGLNDGDCIKIGELTSIIVRIGFQSLRNSKREEVSGAESATVVESVSSEAGLDVDLGKTVTEQPVQKRTLRSRAKKAVDSKSEVENLSSKRTLRSSKKEEKVNFIPTLKQIPENMDVGVSKTTDVSVPIEPKRTRGRTKKLLMKPTKKSELDETQPADIAVQRDGRSTRRGRKQLPLGNVESSDIEVKLDNDNKYVVVDEGNKVTSDISPLENVEKIGLEENSNTNNESTQDHIAEKSVLMQEGCEGQESLVDESLPKGSSEVGDLDKGKAVAEESECRQDDSEGVEKNTGTDNDRWSDLEKMTLGDFFDYLEVQLPKEIYDKTEKIISDLEEKTRKCHELRRQRNEKGKGSLAMD